MRNTLFALSRRQFLILVAASPLCAVDREVTRPEISEQVSPIDVIAPIARDGYRGQGLSRKPPGAGPFPAVLLIHGGMVTRSLAMLRDMEHNFATPSRFLAAGYVTVVLTYRGRDLDPQSKDAIEDCLAAVDHLRRLAYVDPKSIVVYGCSNGGDLALEVASATEVCAIVSEEPASIMLTGVFNSSTPKKGERYEPADSFPILADPKRYYGPENQRTTRAKITRIRCAILIVQGDQHPVNKFNAEVLIPELLTAGKKLEVRTYPGEPHCFCFSGSGPQTPRPAVALTAFRTIETFCRSYVATKPVPIHPSLIREVL